MQTILKVLTGSRLHNLHNDASDWDYRGVFMHPLEDIISPFRNPKTTSWIEGDVDNTAYELRDFCMMATKGNPSILEVLYSNMVIESNGLGEELQKNRHKFLNSQRIFDAYRGYAHNQYNKMNLFEPDARSPKFAVAYLRSLWQGTQLLKTGEIINQVTDPYRTFLLEVKYNFKAVSIEKLSKEFTVQQLALSEAFYANAEKFTPDIEWIEKFLMHAYV